MASEAAWNAAKGARQCSHDESAAATVQIYLDLERARAEAVVEAARAYLGTDPEDTEEFVERGMVLLDAIKDYDNGGTDG